MVASTLKWLGLTFSARRAVGSVGVILVALFGAGFAVGEVSELFQRNVGISAGRWDVVLAASVIGIITALAAVWVLMRPRQIAACE